MGDQLAHVDGVHSSGDYGFHAEVGVFVGPAKLCRNADAAGCFEENIGSWLLIYDVFAGDDGLEKVTNAEVLQHLVDDLARSARGNGERNLAVILSGDSDDRINRLDLSDQREVFSFFFAGDGEIIESHLLFLAEKFKNVARRHASQRIETVFGKMQTVAGGDGLPGTPM